MLRAMRRVFFALLCLLIQPAAADSGRLPNLVVFLVDDMGIMDSSVTFFTDAGGAEVITPLNRTFRTPAMESLAARGLKFTNAYAMPVCSPSRVSLATGMNSARHHVTNWTSPKPGGETGHQTTPDLASPADWRRTGLDRRWTTLPRLLQQAGYRTIHVGKAHFGNDDYAKNPQNIGFDVNVAGRSIGHPGSFFGTYGKGGSHEVPHLQDYHNTGTHLSDALTIEMNRAITRAAEEKTPFFSYLSHYAAHTPFEVDPRFAGHYPGLEPRALGFATLIEGMDKSLGDLLAHLEQLGVAEDTLVVFLSDNGSDSPLGSAPLRANKGSKYEGGSRIPLIAAWAKPNPDNPFQQRLPIKPGSRTGDLVAIFDLFPTLLAVAGVKPPLDQPLDGIDLSPVLRGEAGGRESLLIHFPHAHRSDYYTTFRHGEVKLIHNYGDASYELYDLAKDPGESDNLADARPDLLKSMAEKMTAALEAHAAQWPMRRADGSDSRIRRP